MIYLELFLSFIKVGLFSIGGGYAAIPLIQNQVVDINNWISMSQFANIVAIAETTPGPIAIDSAVLVGIEIAGLPGAIIATMGCILPSFIIVMFLAYIYYRFRKINIVKGILATIRPAVIALIASAGILLLIMAVYGERVIPQNFKSIDIIAISIFVVDLIVLRKWKINPLCVMLMSGLFGIVLYSIF